MKKLLSLKSPLSNNLSPAQYEPWTGDKTMKTELEQCTLAQWKTNRNFSVAKSGLCLHFEYSHLEATPDGFVSSNCCGERLLKNKCPYNYTVTPSFPPLTMTGSIWRLMESATYCMLAEQPWLLLLRRLKKKLQRVRSHVGDFLYWTRKESMWKESEEVTSLFT